MICRRLLQAENFEWGSRMKSLQDEISRMKIKSDLNGFKEWREGTVESTFLNETPPSTFEPVGVLPFLKKTTRVLVVPFRAWLPGFGWTTWLVCRLYKTYFTNEAQIMICVIPFIKWLCSGRVPTTCFAVEFFTRKCERNQISQEI